MAEVKWIKISIDMFDNRKIRYLRRLPDGNNIVLIWVMLLTMAGRCNAGGMIFLTENIPYTAKMLADELDFEENTVMLAMEVLQQLNMIQFVDNRLLITGWNEHQNIEGMEKIKEQNRLRKQKQRELQKALPDGHVTSHVTSRDSHATDIDIDRDIDRDIDIEKEGDREREIKNNVSCAERPGSGRSTPAADIAYRLPLNNGEYHGITTEDIEGWNELYPAVDIAQEIRKMIGWLESNPTRRKTPRGIKAFINSWLSREQDRSKGQPQTQGAVAPKPYNAAVDYKQRDYNDDYFNSLFVDPTTVKFGKG